MGARILILIMSDHIFYIKIQSFTYSILLLLLLLLLLLFYYIIVKKVTLLMNTMK